MNQVWLAPAHVVRRSSGQFRDSLAHEARVLRLVPLEVPHARVVAHLRAGRREWLVLERMPGITLSAAWPNLGRSERMLTARQVSESLRALLQVSVPADVRPPGLDDALAPGGPRRDAYHAPRPQLAATAERLLEVVRGKD